MFLFGANCVFYKTNHFPKLITIKNNSLQINHKSKAALISVSHSTVISILYLLLFFLFFFQNSFFFYNEFKFYSLKLLDFYYFVSDFPNFLLCYFLHPDFRIKLFSNTMSNFQFAVIVRCEYFLI